MIIKTQIVKSANFNAIPVFQAAEIVLHVGEIGEQELMLWQLLNVHVETITLMMGFH